MTEYEPALGPEVLAKLIECENILGYQFIDRRLLHRALTHASGANHRLDSNERLEFLGDAILGSVVCEELYRIFPTALEGELTRIKSVVVSRITCAKISRQLNLAPLLVLGKGLGVGPDLPASVVSDVFEAIVAAVYLDGGLEPARDFVLEHMKPQIEAVTDAGHGENYKSHLQQVAQRQFGNTPVYKLIDEKGPDHSKCFKVAARVGDRLFEGAWGRSKKEAEQRAACNALEEIEPTSTEDSSADVANDPTGDSERDMDVSHKKSADEI
jgi:ribonuclease-3